MPAQRNTRRVKLEELFRYNKELEIRDHEGEIALVVYIRILSERGVEQARLAALRASHELRKSLRDEDSAEYAAMMESLVQLGEEERLSVLIMQDMSEIYNQARAAVQMKLPEQPNSEVLEDYENYEVALDEYDEDVIAAVQEEATVLLDKRKEEYLAREDLDTLFIGAMENQICSNVMTGRFDEELAWRSVYTDKKLTKPYFHSFEEFDNLALEVKRQIVQAYKSLSISRSDLKN